MRELKNANGLPVIQAETTISAGLLDCSPAGIIAVDGAGRIIAFNSTAQQLTLIRAEDVLGRDSGALPPGLQAVIDEVLETGEPVVRRSVALNVSSGRTMAITTTIARHADGSMLSVTAELQDMASARSIASNLEHLDRLAGIGVVTAGVAHEIKNALVAVRTYFDLLKSGESDAELANVAAAEVQRVERVVRQLLRGARRDEFEMTVMSAHTLLQDALNLIRHELQTRSIQLITSLNAPSDKVHADERQLRHAILNLLLNAAESMQPGGKLTVETAADTSNGSPALRVTIRDTGHGIAPENVARLFNPFFTTKADGTGLGLAISRRIIQSHRGTISLDTAVGQGTVFNVVLPLA